MVHRSRDRPVHFRLLPIGQMPREAREAVQRWRDRPPRPNIAPIVHAGQTIEGGWYLIGYGVSGGRTLAELIQSSPSSRLDHAAEVLRAFPGWVEALGVGWLPMPADILVTDSGVPYLLPMPYRRDPDVGAVFEEPSRGWHLAPEIVRGRAPTPSEPADRYALGMTLLRLFHELPLDDPGELLLRVATGTALEALPPTSTLPIWLQELRAARQLRTTLDVLVQAHPEDRSRADPTRLAEELAMLRPWTVPAEAVKRLQAEGRRDDAWLLVLDVLAEDESYEFLLAGGMLAARDPRRWRAGIQLLERAIAQQPGRPDAYEAQLQLLVSAAAMPRRTTTAEPDRIDSQLVELLLRDFAQLPAYKQDRLEVAVAQCLLEQARWRQAAEFVHPRLFRDDSYLWWKFDLNLDYAEALTGIGGRDSEVAALLGNIGQGLDRVEGNGAVPPGEIRRCRQRVARLQALIGDHPGGRR
jgi:hypothetical protein